MGVDWGAARDNENWYLKTFGQSLTGQLSPSEEAYLRNMGVQMPGVDATRAFVQPANPIAWHGELGRSALAANEARYDQVLGLNRLMESLAQNQLNETGQQIQKTTADVNLGYADASRQLDKVGGATQQQILDRERSGIADAEQAARSRGLGSSTIALNARRGVRADTSRALGSLGESLASARSGLALNRANMISERGNILADHMTRRTGIETGLLGNRQSIMANRQDSYNPVDQTAYMQNVGTAAKAGKGGSLLGNIGGLVGGSLLGGITGGLGSALGGAMGSNFFGLFGGGGGGSLYNMRKNAADMGGLGPLALTG